MKPIHRPSISLIGLYCRSLRVVPSQLVFDIDDTFDAGHGEQQLQLDASKNLPESAAF